MINKQFNKVIKCIYNVDAVLKRTRETMRCSDFTMLRQFHGPGQQL